MYIPMWVIVVAWCIYRYMKRQDEENAKPWRSRYSQEELGE